MAGGGYYHEHESGANYVCLPLDPDYNDVSTSGSHAKMYGTEYEHLSKYSYVMFVGPNVLQHSLVVRMKLLLQLWQ